VDKQHSRLEDAGRKRMRKVACEQSWWIWGSGSCQQCSCGGISEYDKRYEYWPLACELILRMFICQNEVFPASPVFEELQSFRGRNSSSVRPVDHLLEGQILGHIAGGLSVLVLHSSGTEDQVTWQIHDNLLSKEGDTIKCLTKKPEMGNHVTRHSLAHLVHFETY